MDKLINNTSLNFLVYMLITNFIKTKKDLRDWLIYLKNKNKITEEEFNRTLEASGIDLNAGKNAFYNQIIKEQQKRGRINEAQAKHEAELKANGEFYNGLLNSSKKYMITAELLKKGIINNECFYLAIKLGVRKNTFSEAKGDSYLKKWRIYSPFNQEEELQKLKHIEFLLDKKAEELATSS